MAEGEGSKGLRMHDHPLGKVRWWQKDLVQFESSPSVPGSALSTNSSAQGPCHAGRTLSAGWLRCCAPSLTQPGEEQAKAPFIPNALPKFVQFCTSQPRSACPPKGRSLHHRCTKGRGRNMPSISSPLVSLPVSSCGFTPLLTGALLDGALGGCFVALMIGKDDRKTQQPCRWEGLEDSVLGTSCILGWKIKGNLVYADCSHQL